MMPLSAVGSVTAGYIRNVAAPDASVGIPNFVPPEVFIELCNEVHANPWITEPYLAADPMTDYIPQYALFIKNNFPNMRPEFETADETWNIATDNGVFAKTRDWFYSTLELSLGSRQRRQLGR